MATSTDITDDPDAGVVIVTGLKLTVTPLGWPKADKVTGELNPPLTAVVIFDVPLKPGATESDVVEAEMVKVAATVTVNATVVVAVAPPPVPVTVIEYLPAAVVAATAMVMVTLPLPGMGIGFPLKLTVTPVGTPVVVNVIAESNVSEMALVIVEVPLEPCATETEVGEAERVKVPGGVTIKLKVAVCVMALPDPVTVMVYVPGVIVEVVSKVRIESPEPGACEVTGLKLAVTPVGTEADHVIAASHPPVRTAATVVLPLPPCCTVTEPGEMLMLKFGVGPVVLERTLSRPTPLGLPQPVTRS